MSREKQVTRRVNIVLSRLNAFIHALTLKDPGFKFKNIDPLIKQLSNELYTQGQELIKQSKVLPKPRGAKKILAEIAESGKLTPELLDEIKRSQD